MRLILKLFPVFLLQLFILESTAQQEIPFTYYMDGNTYFNPAVVGTGEDVNLTLRNKYQWAGFEQTPALQSVSLSVPGRFSRTGYGLNIVNDKLYSLNVLSVTALYAYKIKLSRGLLSFGMNAGVNSYRYDLSRQNIKDADDPRLATYNTRQNKFESAAGFYYHSEKTQAGVSAIHLQDIAVRRKPGEGGAVHYYLTGAHRFYTGHKLYIQPSALIRYVKGLPLDLTVSAMLRKENTGWFGCSASPDGTASLLAGVNVRNIVRSMRPELQIGYAYDYMLFSRRPLKPAAAHEIYLSSDFEFPEKLSAIKKKRNKKSPMLF